MFVSTSGPDNVAALELEEDRCDRLYDSSVQGAQWLRFLDGKEGERTEGTKITRTKKQNKTHTHSLLEILQNL